MEKYYDKEQPIEVISEEHGEMRYYKEAGKIQVSKPKWISPHDQKLHHGKTVTLDIGKFKGNQDMINLLQMALDDLKE